MARSKHDPIHQWKLKGEVEFMGTRFFQYACTQCPAVVRNGQPFSETKWKECK